MDDDLDDVAFWWVNGSCRLLFLATIRGFAPDFLLLPACGSDGDVFTGKRGNTDPESIVPPS